MMWIITRDFLYRKGDDTKSQKGIHTVGFDPQKSSYKFRLLDDDGTVYYHGICDTNDDDNAFEPLDYYLPHSGCTEIQYRNNGKWETL